MNLLLLCVRKSALLVGAVFIVYVGTMTPFMGYVVFSAALIGSYMSAFLWLVAFFYIIHLIFNKGAKDVD